MKFSYNWIREFVPGLDTPAEALERLITIKTAECEGIEPTGELLNQACVARVETIELIEGSKNVIATVQTGRYGRKTVVCGAPNCLPSVITAYVPLGKKVINGVESDGMLASGAELGINKDSAGILILDSQVGAPLPGCVADAIIEIDNKSITHRPDLWGHFGMAREVAAILHKKLSDPVKRQLVPHSPSPVNVKIEDTNLCPRYSALVFENVTVKPSPLWLQCRLTNIGLNPINNIVDLTNYLMAELAQPMHAFDQDKLKGGTIFVRSAFDNEPFRALNKEDYRLNPANLVIADEGGAIALAGVIGGDESAIGDTTTRIVLESANFHPASVRRTSSAMKLRTDASMRFEKSQDPVNTVRALARAVELLQELSPGIRLVGGLADAGRELATPAPIELPLAWLNRKLGRDVPKDEVRGILESLEFGLTESAPGVFTVTVPTWRATKDISMKDDLVEEVGRMIGYDSITPTAPAIHTRPALVNEERRYQHELRERLIALGFTEVYNYSFVSEDAAARFGFTPDHHVGVANPIASNQSLLRTSLLPNIWSNIAENSKHFDQFRLFEIGKEIHKRAEGLPDEVPHLTAVVYTRSGDGVANLFELKHAAESLLAACEVKPATAKPYEHPARTAEIQWRGETVGRLFELHPSLVEGRAAVLDLDLAATQRLNKQETKYTPLRRYPSSAFDLSVIAKQRDLAGDLQSKLSNFAGDMLESIEYLRQYAGPPLPEGTKSVSYRVTIGSRERTLSSDEVAQIRSRIIDGMKGLGYELRV